MSYWKKCGSCKKEIPYKGIYQVCSISGCKKHAYCSVDCWELHNQVLNHKNAWAEEERAPSEDTIKKPKRRIIINSVEKTSSSSTKADIPYDILIVASKLKAYVKGRYDMNTSADVMEKLSDIVRESADEACQKARNEGRKTLMERDF